jgi:hypothetical protein
VCELGKADCGFHVVERDTRQFAMPRVGRYNRGIGKQCAAKHSKMQDGMQVRSFTHKTTYWS